MHKYKGICPRLGGESLLIGSNLYEPFRYTQYLLIGSNLYEPFRYTQYHSSFSDTSDCLSGTYLASS